MRKQAIDIISSQETFTNLQTFESVEELNKAVNYYKKKFQDKLRKNDILVLEHLKRHSCKYFGVSFQTKNNIAEALGLVRITIIRICKKLEKLGIIKQYEMKRKSDMRQTSNAIVIQPIPKKGNVTQDVTQESRENVTPRKNILFKSSSNKNNNNKVNNNVKEVEFDHTYLPSFIDRSFIETAKPFCSAKEIYNMWFWIKVAYKKFKLDKPLSEYMEVVNKAFKETVFLYKQGRITDSFSGYFYRLVEAAFGVEKRRENKHLLFNWLEA
jgi:DNA-binding Lrp family transcriptional regulator